MVGATTAASATTYQFQNLGTNFLDGGSGTWSAAVYANIPSAGVNKNISAGVFNSVLVKNGTQTIATYSVCNDLTQSIGWAGSSTSTYTPQAIVLLTDTSVSLSGAGSLPSSVSVPSSTARSEIAYLMDMYLYGANYQTSTDSVFKISSSTYATNKEKAAGLQAAIWYLWYGSSSTIDPYDSGTQTVMNNLLAAAAGNQSYKSTTAVWVYNNQSCGLYQDQLMVLNTPVPEPLFFQMSGMAGLVLAGFRLRKRRA